MRGRCIVAVSSTQWLAIYVINMLKDEALFLEVYPERVSFGDHDLFLCCRLSKKNLICDQALSVFWSSTLPAIKALPPKKLMIPPIILFVHNMQ